jgi:hypothetical protein
MRRIVDQNEMFQVVKLIDGKGNTRGYQVEDKREKPGTANFVAAFTPSLMMARQKADIAHRGTGETTAPKSEYPEQQRGFRRR